jgi:hypothetical protein
MKLVEYECQSGAVREGGFGSEPAMSCSISNAVSLRSEHGSPLVLMQQFPLRFAEVILSDELFKPDLDIREKQPKGFLIHLLLSLSLHIGLNPHLACQFLPLLIHNTLNLRHPRPTLIAPIPFLLLRTHYQNLAPFLLSDLHPTLLLPYGKCEVVKI